MFTRNLFAVATLLLCSSISQLSGQNTIEVDVCVYGGTSAGVIAAYTSSKKGKSTILIEPGRHLGGLSTGGLGYTDIGNKYIITGLALDFYRRIGKQYEKLEQWTFEPKVAEAIFNDYAARGGFQKRFEMRLKSVKKTGTKITEIVVENSNNPNPATDITIKAKMFLDCGYEGDLMAQAGVSFTVGREAKSTYNEYWNGVQLTNLHQFPNGIDPYVAPGQPQSGFLWGISDAPLMANGTGDNKAQAYNYRICLTSNAQNRIEITEPVGYDASRYELLLRLMTALNKKSLGDYFIWSYLPNNKVDVNSKGGFSTDMVGMNYNYPNGSYAQRKQIILDHEIYTKGLLYFLGHNPKVPIEIRTAMLKWGYPKDEYIDNGNWSPQLYIREARRMVGNYIMTSANCNGGRVVTDGVGRAAYPMDSHNVQRLVVNGQVKNEGNVEVGGFGPYPVAYNALIPKSAECTNLLVPVCLSASHIAYGSIRMEPVFMVLAQSSATAAVMAIDANTDVQNVNVPQLQQNLENDPLADGSIFEVLVDNTNTNNIQITGTWTLETSGGYGPNFLTNPGTSGANDKVKFTPNIPTEGVYHAYYYFPVKTDISSKTTINVFDGRSTTKQIIVNKTDIVVSGQTSGAWFDLGTYNVPKGSNTYIEVTTSQADGKIFADAALWVPEALQPEPDPDPDPDPEPTPRDTLRSPENPAYVVMGLTYSYYTGAWSTLPDFSKLTPIKTGITSNVDLSLKTQSDNFAFRFKGYIDVPADGAYTFYTTSDDGSQLFIGDTMVVNNDGLHGAIEKSGKVNLKKGKHAITITFFERTGGESLVVKYEGSGIPKQNIPATAYYRPIDKLRNPENPANTVNGLDYYYYIGQWSLIPDFLILTPVRTGNTLNVDLTARTQPDNFAFKFKGFIDVPADGTYTFYTTSDDGSQLFIGDTMVVNNDGLHGAIEQSGVASLKRGKHSITVTYFERNGGESIIVNYEGPGVLKQNIPRSAYFRTSTVVPATIQASTKIQTTEMSVPKTSIQNSITIYPNPAKGEIVIEVTAKILEGIEIQLLDHFGQEIKNQRFKAMADGLNIFRLDITDFKNGLYYVGIKRGNEFNTTRIVIQN
ncbi:MAG TPA: FAD-dependent oxidoreductase [Chryseolinea sp.]|nr:FAD-dependent oxidoreductase [Chryseolinea sp.]